MRLKDSVALITGASSGIGAATAAALAAAGARVLLAGRDPARLADMARRTGGVALPADLATAEGPARLAEAAIRASDGIDILINNAGLGWSGPVSEISAETISELVTVNLTAAMELTRLLVPGMIQRRRGRLVFVSSIAGVTGVRGEAVYSATKAGLVAFAESLAYELAEHAVGVSVIIPGVIDTPFFDRRGKAYGRARPAPVPAERAAQAIVAALAHDRAVAYVPGWMRVPAWLHGAAPTAFRILATRFGDPG
jgi:short-subunit dehydrogenase